MYQQQGSAGSQPGAGPTPGGDEGASKDDVIEAEVVDENK